MLDGEVWRRLQDWLPPNDDPDRPQLTLSTVTPDGRADARTVLLSEFDADGFYFHTDARSRKAAQLAANPAVALTVLWPNFTRQLVVQGTAEPAPAPELARAYRRRSAYLQQLAWLNTADFARLPRAERVARWAACAADHPDGFAQPPTWTGYLVRPSRLTFWEGDPEAASRRTEFTHTEFTHTEFTAGPAGWQVSHLPG
jgi:pyridoxamine 5'-phosphate oxidase